MGVLLTIAIHLYESSDLYFSYLINNKDGQFMEKPIMELFLYCPNAAIINVEGDLSFGAVEELEIFIYRCQHVGVKVLILV